MKPLVATLAAAWLAVAALPAVAQTSNAAALARVETALAGLSSVQSAFTQQLLDAKGAVRERAAGRLYLKRPGRFRWEYDEPAGQLVVGDGRNLWLYDAELEQVTVRPVGVALAATPALLLSGQARVSEAFTAQAAPPADGLDWVTLEPKVAEADFRSVRLGFRGPALARLEFRDRLGQTTRIDLVRIERNAQLDDSLFRFERPPGVDLVGTPAP